MDAPAASPLYALVFVVGPEALLPASATAEQLELLQRSGIGSAAALRIFRTPGGWEGSLDELVADGRADASGHDPFLSPPPAAAQSEEGGGRRRLICDALVPHFDPRSDWIGVYLVEGDPREAGPTEPLGHPLRALAIRSIRCLDRFALRDAENETCWFYPTEDGTYLGWENQRRVETLPGFLPERVLLEEPPTFERADLHVLWSLMADDLALTCVGFTLNGRRIDWPLRGSEAEPFATWTAFRVDSSAEASYGELANITVFQA